MTHPLNPNPLTEAEQAATLQQLFDQQMQTPLALPTRWAVDALSLADGSPALLLQFQRPTDTVRIVLGRDDVLALVSELKRKANTGPSLVLPTMGDAVRIAAGR